MKEVKVLQTEYQDSIRVLCFALHQPLFQQLPCTVLCTPYVRLLLPPNGAISP